MSTTSHDASEAVGPLKKRFRSARSEHTWDGNRIEDVSNDDAIDSRVSNNDGLLQLAKEESQSLLFSCQPMRATSGDHIGSADNVQQMSLFKLDGAKYKIFLSHSGAQKDFVEQLCVDLERHGYFFPFFDERNHSLPKGKDFAPLIMEAARLCNVAVIVLSEEFLSSKWPMVELAEFYCTQQQRGGGGHKLEMLPLFFKLSIEDVKDEDRWMPIWKQHASKDKRIDVTKWSAAVKALCKSNGLRFDKDAMKKEVAYRKLVVQNILGLSPPDLLYGSSESMVGYNGMCEGVTLMESFMRREPVFLVVDNVTNDRELQEEAKAYLMVGFHPKSKIMIVAKSEAILKDLLPSIEFSVSMPELQKEEAGELFLKHAAPMKSIFKLTYEERDIIEICTRKCWFGSEDGGSYHPLALRALADVFFRLGNRTNNQMLVWKDHLDKGMVSTRDVWSSKDGLYDILDMQFSTYEFDEKLLFLDIAYFMHHQWFGYEGYVWFYDIVEFYSQLCDESSGEVIKRLENLEKSGMITKDDGYVLVPELYKKFAEWYVSDHEVKGLRNVRGVFRSMGTKLRGDPASSSKSWDDLVRLRIVDISRANAGLLSGKAMQEMSRLGVLQLSNCPNITELNLKGLDSLHHLELDGLRELVTLLLPGTDEYSGIHYSLQEVRLVGLDNLCDLPDFRPCRSLYSFTLSDCTRLTNLEVLECPQLEKLIIEYIAPGQYDHDQEYKFEGLPNFENLHCLEELSVSAPCSDGHYYGVTWGRDTRKNWWFREFDQHADGYALELFLKLHSVWLQKWEYIWVRSDGIVDY